MITVVTVFTKGSAGPFPEKLKGIAGEGSVHTDDQIGEGGVIVASFDTDIEDLVREAFENHLESNEMSAFSMQRVDDLGFFYWKKKTHIF